MITGAVSLADGDGRERERRKTVSLDVDGLLLLVIELMKLHNTLLIDR